MKILQYKDCEMTTPPSTGFIFFPEFESDLAFIAEVKDLPTCNRVINSFKLPDQEAEAIEAQRLGQTPRMGLQSLYDHLQNSPSSNESYAREAIMWACLVLNVDEDTLLKKAFWLRTFWF